MPPESALGAMEAPADSFAGWGQDEEEEDPVGREMRAQALDPTAAGRRSPSLPALDAKSASGCATAAPPPHLPNAFSTTSLTRCKMLSRIYYTSGGTSCRSPRPKLASFEPPPSAPRLVNPRSPPLPPTHAMSLSTGGSRR